MSSPAIVDGDRLAFSTQFGERTVTPVGPLTLSGRGLAKIAGKAVCIAGDEKQVSIAATYFTSLYPQPGQGKITISQLAADQLSLCCRSEERLIIKGSQFTALFTPDSPASNPNSGPDTNKAATPGTGKFINSQDFVNAI